MSCLFPLIRFLPVTALPTQVFFCWHATSLINTESMSLSPAQVEAYLDRISLPVNVRDLLREGPEGKDALKAVAALQQYHLATIPFENLDLCYSSHKTIPQGTEAVFDHVINRQRGGVCDQVHPLFARLLRSLGFVVYLTGARINAAAGILQGPGADVSKASFTPWSVFSPL